MKQRYACLASILVLSTATLLAAADKASARSCGEREALLDAVKSSHNIVVVKIRSVGDVGRETSGVSAELYANASVEAVYKGGMKPGQDIWLLANGMISVDWRFSDQSVGESFLLYLPARPNYGEAWRLNICSRSASISEGAADLLFLSKHRKVAGKTRLSGRLTRQISIADPNVRSQIDTLSQRKVRITGNGKTVDLKTDNNGVYEIYGLPPGEYSIAPQPFNGYIAYSEAGSPADGSRVSVSAGKHSEVDFTYHIRNSISGRLLDSDGRPLENVCVKLMPVDAKDPSYYHASELTKADGSFAIEGSAAGTYVIAVNDEKRISATAPFPVFFYPSAKDRSAAGQIHLDAGTVIDGLQIVAPASLEIVTVTGRVKLEDGKPATSESTQRVTINFESHNKASGIVYVDSEAKIDDEGRFVIRILKGQAGRLFASTSVYRGKYKNCPRFDRLFPIKGEGHGNVESSSVEITADVDQAGVELVFPFPTCTMIKDTW